MKVNCKQANSRGNPKTLTPGPWTPTTDWVHGLPMVQSMDYPYGPTLQTTPQSLKAVCSQCNEIPMAKRRKIVTFHLWLNLGEIWPWKMCF